MSIYSISIYIYIYFYIYLEKRTERSPVLLQKNETFSRSFPFFAKECSVLCVLFPSLQKNGAFFAFFSVFLKRMDRSFSVLFVFISHTNIANLEKKEHKRTFRPFFDIYLYIYVYIYLYIYLYISIYISIYI